jgi:uncharacterized membrane protein
MWTLVAAHPGPWHDGEMAGWWPVLPIMWGLSWSAVTAGIFFLLRRRHVAADPAAGALSVLAERYARGEIDADEYQARLVLLREGRQRP